MLLSLAQTAQRTSCLLLRLFCSRNSQRTCLGAACLPSATFRQKPTFDSICFSRLFYSPSSPHSFFLPIPPSLTPSVRHWLDTLRDASLFPCRIPNNVVLPSTLLKHPVLDLFPTRPCGISSCRPRSDMSSHHCPIPFLCIGNLHLTKPPQPGPSAERQHPSGRLIRYQSPRVG